MHRTILRAVPSGAAGSLIIACCTLFAGCGGVRSGAVARAQGPADCARPFTRIGDIQGKEAISPLTGQQVVTQGVVIGDYEGAAPALRGFYIQDPRGDGDATTSDGIFVFNGDRDDVGINEIVRVAGTVDEVREQTQITASSIVACGTGRVEPTEVTLPLGLATYLERYEGMLVRLPQTLYVTGHYQLGRYGEVVLSSGERLPQPTSVAPPGDAARAVQSANDVNRIILDDASQEQNPAVIAYARGGAPLSAANTLRGGDHVTGLTGVLTQTSASASSGDIAYRIRPAAAGDDVVATFVGANPRAAPPQVGGNLRIASFNALNYFNTFDSCTLGVGGGATPCRGAENAVEFERQWRKVVSAIVAMDPDILGIIEMENDGYAAGSAIAHLVDRLNEATQAGRFAFIDADAGTGQQNALGTDAIKVGLIHKTRVSPVGRTAVLNSAAFVNAGESAPRNRPSLAQAFAQPDGGRVVVVINHFKSKGSPCDAPGAGDGQGHCNAARTVAARELLGWLTTDPTGTGEPDVLILGDLNAYVQEDPITVMTDAGYTDLLTSSDDRTYTYVFDAQWGYLDHALASASLRAQVTGAAAWHSNADEPSVLDYNTNFRSAAQQTTLYSADPFRSSDHDPVIVGLALEPAAAATAAIRWVPERVVEGTLLSIIVDGDAAVRAATGEFAGELLHFRARADGSLVALAAAPLDSTGARQLRIELTHDDGTRRREHVTVPVEPGAYRLEQLSVAPEFGRPQPAAIQRRIADEAARARAVSTRSHATPRMWEAPFVPPRESRITSGFGHGRVFNGVVQSRHTGTDFAGAVGAPVRAPARGIVALVDDFYLGGGVIYIDHGAGLVTAYLHLSAKNVAEGDVVEPGQVIGRVGATGRVTGPHLHWIVRYGNHTVDAISLLNLPDG
jgi:uncharacterized protein